MSWHARARARAHRSEAGVTLLEVLFTVILLGAVMTTMMSAVLTTTVSSDQVRAGSVADAELHRYADYVRTVGYAPCADPPQYAYPYSTVAGEGAPETSVTGRVVSIDYWPKVAATVFRRGGNITFLIGWPAGATEEAAGSPCKSGALDVDGGLQRITLEIKVVSNIVVTRQVTIIKRKDTQ